MTQETFNLIAAKMEAMKQVHIARLNADLFRDGGGPYPTVKPRPWFVRYGWMVRGYLSTLWRALKGEDPFETDDY